MIRRFFTCGVREEPRVRLLLTTLLVTGLAACVPVPVVTHGVELGTAEIECIDAARVVRRLPVGDNAVLFELAGRESYRNQFAARCPGLARAENFGRFLFEVNGGRLCRGDSFRVIDPSAAAVVGAGAFPRCRLGGFTRVISTPRALSGDQIP